MTNLVKILCYLLANFALGVSDQLKVGNAKFAQEFYNVLQITQSSDSNFIYSPFSLSSCVGLLAIGANGSTLTELQDVMHYPKNEMEFVVELRDIYTSLQNSSLATVRIANGVFPSIKFQLGSLYLEKSSVYFNASLQKLNYGDPSSSAKQINEFVENATNRKIKNIVSSRDLPGNTELVLVNALYFKSAWGTKFFKPLTSTMPFHLTLDEQSNVTMMRNVWHVPYAEMDELDVQVLALPNKDERFNMLVILSKAKDGIIALEEKLETINFGTLHSKLKLREVDFSLPKFKIESEIKVDKLLKHLGVKLVFSDGKADLSRLSNVSSLYVDSIVQKVHIEVDEEGTEAAAATLGFGVDTSLTTPPKFVADHPFIIAIEYTSEGFASFISYLAHGASLEVPNPNANETATMLFLGRVKNPNKN